MDFAVGGQAVIEGVMMKSPSFVTVAVRKKNGAIKLHKFEFKSLTKRFRILSLPILRGIINLFEMLGIGMRALNFSANEFADDGVDEKAKAPQNEKKSLFDVLTMIFSLILSLFLAVFLFKFIPLSITEWLRKTYPFIAAYYFVFNLIDGIIRIAIFILYIFALSLFKDFRRIFSYHGAEHKSIFTYEKNLLLTVQNSKDQIRFHPRCGTSFILIILLISIVIYTFVPRNPIFWVNLAQRIAIVPLIAGAGYEILKWSAKRTGNPLIKFFVAPGLFSQRLTTKEPDERQLEVALRALEYAVELERDSKTTTA